MNYKSILYPLAIIFLIGTATANAQQEDIITKKEEKAYDKAYGYYKKAQKSKGDKVEKYYNKAIVTLMPVLTAHPKNEIVWNTMVGYYYSRYFVEAYVVDVIKEFREQGMKNAKDAAEKEAYKNLKIDTVKMHEYKMGLLDMCRQATFNCEKQEYASMYLRLLLYEETSYPDIDENARDKFNQAEDEFVKKNYLGAIKLYKEAYKIDSNYYKAVVYIGDSYYANADYDNAVTWFQKAISMRPGKLEPRKYLVDAYMEQRKDDKAYDECVNAILVHPDVGMFMRLETIAKRLGKTYNRHWMSRDFEPNKNLQVPADSPWKYYYDAKKNIAQYCDENGVITKENTLTKQKYMEVYCWEYMLQNTSDSRFSFAKKAQEAGYLDCYVFLSLYHTNINDQFEHFAKNNADRAKKYFDKYVMEE